MQICLGGIRLRDRLSRLRIGVTDLGQRGLPLLVAFRGRNKHYTLLWLVEGEVGERDLVALMLLGDQRHRRVHPRRWTRHSISRIIRCMSKRMHCFKNQFGSAGRTGPTVNRMGVRFESLIGSTMQSNRWNPVRLGQNR